jgi:hypothetical protein
MVSADTKAVIVKAKTLYENGLRSKLEQSDFGKFAAIEPESGEYFLGDTLDAAVNAALQRYPDRLTHTIRVGHPAALHMGVLYT